MLWGSFYWLTSARQRGEQGLGDGTNRDGDDGAKWHNGEEYDGSARLRMVYLNYDQGR